jgi:hypothetical protein
MVLSCIVGTPQITVPGLEAGCTCLGTLLWAAWGTGWHPLCICDCAYNNHCRPEHLSVTETSGLPRAEGRNQGPSLQLRIRWPF